MFFWENLQVWKGYYLENMFGISFETNRYKTVNIFKTDWTLFLEGIFSIPNDLKVTSLQGYYQGSPWFRAKPLFFVSHSKCHTIRMVRRSVYPHSCIFCRIDLFLSISLQYVYVSEYVPVNLHVLHTAPWKWWKENIPKWHFDSMTWLELDTS